MPSSEVNARHRCPAAYCIRLVMSGCQGRLCAGGSYRITADATAGAAQREMPDSARRRAASDSGVPSLDQDCAPQQHSSKASVAPSVEAPAADALSVQGHGYKAAEGPAASNGKPEQSAESCGQDPLHPAPDVHPGRADEAGTIRSADSAAAAATSSQTAGEPPGIMTAGREKVALKNRHMAACLRSCVPVCLVRKPH